MAIAHETVVYDVHDFKVYALTVDTGGGASALTYGAAVDVPGIAEVSMEPNFLTAELKGDARIIAKKGRVDKINISATYGKVSLDVLAVILGGTIVDAGSGSTETARWRLLGDNSLPYFKCEFKIADVDTGLGDVTVVLYKGQLTGGTLLSGTTDEFGQPEMQIEGIATDANDQMVDVTFHETDTALSA